MTFENRLERIHLSNRVARVTLPFALGAGVISGSLFHILNRSVHAESSSVDPMNPFLDTWSHSQQGRVDQGQLPDPAILTQSGASIGRNGVLYWPIIHTQYPAFTGTKPWSPGTSLQQDQDLSCGTPDYADFLAQNEILSGSV
ncbi:MAG: hypothetical protein ACOCXT_05020, partial [Candidatus Dojkabacteria bacterium]